jgi:hypothetical protein
MTVISFRQYLTEYSHTPDSILTHLKKLGYKKLGSGVDQTAFLDPKTGQVLKIFGAQPEWRTGKNGYSADQRMFKYWVTYCEKNKSNPFLPKFGGWEGFSWEGSKYLQIKMEKLQKLPPRLGQALHELSEYFNSSSSPTNSIDDIITHLGNLSDSALDYNRGVSSQERDEIDKLAVLLGEKDFKLFLNTIVALSKMADDKNYTFDLHGDNFMHRNDGIPVIVDPWVI